MQGDIALTMERDPDFFALSAARGEGRTVVATVDNRIVACGAVTRRTCYLLGEPASAGYVADLRVLPSARRQGLARLILGALADAERNAAPAPYVASVAAGNRPIDEMTATLADRYGVHLLGTSTAYQLLYLGRPAIDRNLAIAPAHPNDEDRLAAFLDAFYRLRNFAPVFADGGFRRILDASPGMDLGCYRLATVGGRIVAAVGLWDVSTLKRTRVYRLPRSLRWGVSAARGLRRVLPLPALPMEGEVLRVLYLRHPAHAPGAGPALRTLLRAVLHETAGQGYHFALFTASDADPLVRSLRRLPRLAYHYSLYAGVNAPQADGSLARLRGTLLYDDAALS